MGSDAGLGPSQPSRLRGPATGGREASVRIHCVTCRSDARRIGERAATSAERPPAMRAIHALNEIAGHGANVLDLATSRSFARGCAKA